jgi:hypothetical protein
MPDSEQAFQEARGAWRAALRSWESSPAKHDAEQVMQTGLH